MTTTLLGDFALISEVKDKDLLNKLLESGRGWKLLATKEKSFLIGFPRKLFNDINEYNLGLHRPQYDYFWGGYLYSDGEPIHIFINFLNDKENEVFTHLVSKNLSTHNYTRKRDEMADELNKIQKEYDCFIKCLSCKKDIKLPDDYNISSVFECRFCGTWNSIDAIGNLSDVISQKKKKVKKEPKKRFWK
jgi:hypothetical protein